MTTHELWDCIADSVNPTLGLLALSAPWLRGYRIGRPSSAAQIAATVACVGIGAAYAALMMYQGYHAFVDIIATAMPIGFACRAVWRHRLLKQELIVDARI